MENASGLGRDKGKCASLTIQDIDSLWCISGRFQHDNQSRRQGLEVSVEPCLIYVLHSWVDFPHTECSRLLTNKHENTTAFSNNKRINTPPPSIPSVDKFKPGKVFPYITTQLIKINHWLLNQTSVYQLNVLSEGLDCVKRGFYTSTEFFSIHQSGEVTYFSVVAEFFTSGKSSFTSSAGC